MKANKCILGATLFILTCSAYALPRVDIKQEFSCGGVKAYTTPSDNGEYLLMTSIEVAVGGLNKEFYSFYDDEKMAMGVFLPDITSEAGCDDCLPRGQKHAISEHWWQEAEYEFPNDYCPGTGAFGIWDGNFCDYIERSHPGCTIM